MREMKDSGIEWVGAIPATWKIHPLYYYFCERKCKNTLGKENNLLSLSYGRVIRKDINTVDGLLPENYNGYNIIEKDDIVLRLTDLQNDKRSLRTGLVREHGIITSAYTTIKANRELVPEFFQYLLHSYDVIKVLYNMGSGVRQGLNFSELSKMPLISPDMLEQKKIADFLDTKCSEIDAISADIQKEIETLEQYKRSVITEAVTKGLNPDVEMKDSQTSWFGNIPQNWSTCKTLYVLKQPITDGPHTTPELYDEGIPFVSAEAVSCGNGDIDFEHIRGYISQEFYDECCKKYIPQKYDIYMIKSGATTGKVAIVTTEKVFTIWSPLAAFRCDENKMLPYFLYYSLQATPFQNQVQDGWNYGTQQNIGMRTLEKLKICKPPLTEQKQIVDYLNKKCSETNIVIKELYSQLKTLASYKESIIYEYVTGKKEVLI